uniref:Uncharacterized protein n=1 Tax=Siphoviridae sp. ctu3K14 TaxID=2826500 RepID=A0A8S5N8W1_9CAUD|nr:MAG TPA: hypothetical protein [Siphoviridae sp. ctu3K14]
MFGLFATKLPRRTQPHKKLCNAFPQLRRRCGIVCTRSALFSHSRLL